MDSVTCKLQSVIVQLSLKKQCRDLTWRFSTMDRLRSGMSWLPFVVLRKRGSGHHVDAKEKSCSYLRASVSWRCFGCKKRSVFGSTSWAGKCQEFACDEGMPISKVAGLCEGKLHMATLLLGFDERGNSISAGFSSSSSRNCSCNFEEASSFCRNPATAT